MRSKLVEHRGYECKGEAGKFLLVFQKADDAIRFSMCITEALLEIEWDPMTLLLERMAPRHNSDGTLLVCGPGIAMGMCTGVPTGFAFNPTSDRMDYFGTLVNRAARTHAKALAGEVCFDSTTHDALSYDITTESEFLIQKRGAFHLKGIAEETDIYHILPFRISTRFDWCVFHRLQACACSDCCEEHSIALCCSCVNPKNPLSCS